MEIASQSQLRWAFLRAIAIIVPLVLMFAALATNYHVAGQDDWYSGVSKPPFAPRSATQLSLYWALTLLLVSIATAIIWHAKGNKLRGAALGLLSIIILCGLLWAPLCLGDRQLTLGVLIGGLSVGTTIVALPILFLVRKSAAILLLLAALWIFPSAYISIAMWQGQATVVPNTPSDHNSAVPFGH